MLIFYATLLIPALSSAIAASDPSTIDALQLTVVKTKRGIVDPGHHVARDHHKYRPSKESNPSDRPPQTDNSQSYKNYKPNKQETSKTHHGPNGPSPYQSLRNSPPYESSSRPNFDSFHAVSNGYKAANDGAKPSKPIGGHHKFSEIKSYNPNRSPFNRNAGIQSEAPANGQVPVYRSNYYVPKAEGFSKISAPGFQSTSSSVPSFRSFERTAQNHPKNLYSDTITMNIDGKKVKLPVLQVQDTQNLPGYLQAFESQPLVLSPGFDHQTLPTVEFNFGTSKSNVAQPSAHFLQPYSSFQGQVVPIQTTGSSPQFPQYKGASVGGYPAVGTLPKASGAYEPLRAQPHLHFGNFGQPVHPVTQPGYRHFPPSQAIRTDVELINKKKPPPPPKKETGDENDKEEDHGYKSDERGFGRGSQEDGDYGHRPETYFRESPMESDFTPSKSFPFKQYDETFAKYSKETDDEESREKPYSKYRDYSSSSGEEDDDEDDAVSKFRSENSPSKQHYRKYDENDKEGEASQQREKPRKVDESSEYEYKSQPYRYDDKNLEEEFESYRKESPKQKYGYTRESPEVEEKLSKYSHRSNNSDRSDEASEESEEPSSEGSNSKYNYQRTPKVYKNSEGYRNKPSAKTPKVVHEEVFPYKNPQKENYSKRT